MTDDLRNIPHVDGITVFGIESHAVEKEGCLDFDINNPEGGTFTFVSPEYAIQVG
ncbi:hypothetical protein [Halocynthiibacter styelae]|uniref:Uncharacterized protein n=1 Tax=Halocynthiibacter styelae TaxID=2761955 RepID=A0A8J7IEY4_9RHOB|nr:hypothetical protein [Paenihalocynthiibacter styelae]MBI1495449.1 hypothetical protein [Paenihalocynthiibacter styelae]